VLSLRGQRKFTDEVKRDDYHRVERSYGAFARTFSLPTVVDTGNIKAEFKDGLLQLTLPKREEAKPRQIQINVAK
jgi:HSP20 family protein